MQRCSKFSALDTKDSLTVARKNAQRCVSFIRTYVCDFAAAYPMHHTRRHPPFSLRIYFFILMSIVQKLMSSKTAPYSALSHHTIMPGQIDCSSITSGTHGYIWEWRDGCLTRCGATWHCAVCAIFDEILRKQFNHVHLHQQQQQQQ